MYNILPEWLYAKLKNEYLIDYIFEVRIRLNKPITINYKGNYIKLINKNDINTECLIANQELINYIITKATKHSLYAYNNQIKNAYITTDNGVRIGLCGNVVYEGNMVSTIKNISSLNIRIAHQVFNCSERIINLIYMAHQVKNTLIISPPGAGKTTFIRDIAIKLSDEKKVQNILIIDERLEIYADFFSFYNSGYNIDVISGCNKDFAFNEGLKSMSPSVIITDEIVKETDIDSIKLAINSGVKVIATAHASNINDLLSKNYLNKLIKEKYFERIIILSKRNGVGTIESVFDENLKGIYLPCFL